VVFNTTDYNLDARTNPLYQLLLMRPIPFHQIDRTLFLTPTDMNMDLKTCSMFPLSVERNFPTPH